jgi:hypothetical protein
MNIYVNINDVNHKVIPTKRPPKLVPTFADRECRVVSATDPHGR